MFGRSNSRPGSMRPDIFHIKRDTTEDGPQNIYGRLISALPSIRPYIDHRARVHNSSSPLEDAVTSLLGQSVSECARLRHVDGATDGATAAGGC